MNNLLLSPLLDPNAIFVVSVNILICPARLEILDAISIVNEEIFRKFAGRLLNKKNGSVTTVSPITVSTAFPDSLSQTIVGVKIN